MRSSFASYEVMSYVISLSPNSVSANNYCMSKS